MNHIPRLSEAVYVGMCQEVGTHTEVKIRREVTDTDAVLRKPVHIMSGLDGMLSGSDREGFRLTTSDHDWMLWVPDHKVICDLSQISHYSTPQHTVILMECEDLPPGFTRLMMLTPSSDQIVNSSCIAISGEIYVSSSLFRARFLDLNQTLGGLWRSSIQHGPCATLNFIGQETDFAHCLRSHHWPNAALPWIQRCQHKRWPPDSVLSAIIKEGCHVVPISSDPLNPERDTEWRISFSGAEQKLVYFMNHCQFLCYGLLKIFLKEVINGDGNDSGICSYFMKTVVFWVIQDNNLIDWIPCNLLTCFWTCFKLLISWVYKGECPNFFIPQNNMFRVKVVGQRQAALFDQLYVLYCKGIPCLLLSPTIRKFLRMPILDRTLSFKTDESNIISNVILDQCLLNEITPIGAISPNDVKEFVGLIMLIEQLHNSRLTSYQTATTQFFLSELIHNFSWFLLSQNFEALSNKKRSYFSHKSLNLMKFSKKIGCLSNILDLAMYYHRTCQYEQSLKCLYRAQERMSKPYVIYLNQLNEEMYTRATEGMSLSEKMRKCFMLDIRLYATYDYIDELVPEQEANSYDGGGLLRIPPLVMLHLLFALSHHRLGDAVRSQQSIQDLHTMLLYDDGKYVPINYRDISWQILGICQETSGNYVGAMNSFQYSLQQSCFHQIQNATMLRMQRINVCHLSQS